MTGAVAWLASTVEPIVSLGWGAVILAGIAGACAISLAVTACLVGWRYLGHDAPHSTVHTIISDAFALQA